MNIYNSEHYPDPTMAFAIERATKEQRIEKAKERARTIREKALREKALHLRALHEKIKRARILRAKPLRTITNKIIAVDFDGTICTDNYPEIGKPKHHLIHKLRALSKTNTLILWTCRTGDLLEKAIVWCKKHKLYFHYINENSKEVLEKYNFKDSRKITADIYLDDKSRRWL